jgi:hypothetical protein
MGGREGEGEERRERERESEFTEFQIIYVILLPSRR